MINRESLLNGECQTEVFFGLIGRGPMDLVIAYLYVKKLVDTLAHQSIEHDIPIR